MAKKDDLKTGVENLEDVLGDQYKLENVLDDKYLGDMISVDGRNAKNIAAKVAKATGILKQVKNILEDMCLGPFYLKVALVLRNSLFLNGFLTNLEASYGLTDAEIEQLEKVDEQLLRAILECPCSVPKEMLYLELGVTPIRYIIMCRRLLFYQEILKQPNNSLMYKFYQTQHSNPTKNDWCLTVKSNMETLNIQKSESELKLISEFSFSELVKAAVKKESFQYLNSLKSGHSKVLHIQYDHLKMQDYFLTNKLSTQLKKFTFLCRSRMLAVGANFKAGNQKPLCPICKVAYDSQCHLLVCDKLLGNKSICEVIPQYDDLGKVSKNKTKNSGIFH